MTSGTSSPRSPDHSGKYLRDTIGALADEVRAQQLSGSRTHNLRGGERLAEDSRGALYRFEIEDDSLLPDGVPVLLVVGATQFDAEVLHREEADVLLHVARGSSGELPTISVPRAQLRAEPWYLTEELRKRVEELDTARFPPPGLALLERLAATGPLPERPKAPSAEKVGIAAAGLNGNQVEAITRCLTEPLWFVWGPPGTGKTSTLGAAVCQATLRGDTVVVAAHSNVAVDAALLAASKHLLQVEGGDKILASPAVLRAGVPALTAARELRASGWDRVMDSDPALLQRYEQVRAELARISRGNGVVDRSSALRRELGEIRSRIKEVELSLIAGATLLFCTLSKLVITPAIHQRRFTMGMIDEASMAYPAQVLVASQLASHRLSIFGDFRQLPPIVMSEGEPARHLLGRDVFVSANATTPGSTSSLTMLQTQYRMNPEIRSLVSDFSYNGRLADGAGVEPGTRPMTEHPPAPGAAVVMVNSRLLGGRGWRDAAATTRCNPISAHWAFRYAAGLVEAGAMKVSVLAPYRAQAQLMTGLVRDGGLARSVQVGTVHRFQGAESEAVVFDVTDAKPLGIPGRVLKGDVGKRLVNVAISRAQGKLVVIADPTLKSEQASFREGSRLFRRLADEHEHRPGIGPWSLSHGEVSVEHFDDLDEVRKRFQVDAGAGVSHSFKPKDAPDFLRTIVGDPTPEGQDQAIVFLSDLVWIIAQLPSMGWIGWRVASPRFASTLLRVLTGSSRGTTNSSRPRRVGKAGQVEPLACGHCGSPADLTDATGVLVVQCGTCADLRAATPTDLTEWAIQNNRTCLRCGHELAGRSGKHGLFFGCRRYPLCKGLLSPADVGFEGIEGIEGPAVEDEPRVPGPGTCPECGRRPSGNFARCSCGAVLDPDKARRQDEGPVNARPRTAAPDRPPRRGLRVTSMTGDPKWKRCPKCQSFLSARKTVCQFCQTTQP